jgi:hypothetical protein
MIIEVIDAGRFAAPAPPILDELHHQHRNLGEGEARDAKRRA